MKKDTIIEIPYVVYPFNLIVTYLPYKKLKKELKKRLPKSDWADIKLFNDDYNGMTYMFEGGVTCINFKNFTPGVLSHEAFHAVHFLMDAIDMPLSQDSSEAYAYLLGYIVNKVTENS